MNRSLICLLSLVLGGVAAAKPNIVFILADDLGYGEVGVYGQKKIKTPHMDRLASDGMRFTQHYSGAPVCAPARCVLMTGRHLARAEVRGNREVPNKEGRFGGQHPLSPEAFTIAELLKQQGYATGVFGKWGLGASASTGSPIKQGFDTFFGYNCQRMAHSYYPPYLDHDEGIVPINDPAIPGRKRQPEGEVLAETYRSQNYAPDLILEKSLEFLEANKDRPFFLYLPFVEPHVAIQPPQEWIDRYPADWDDGPYRGERGYLPHPRPRAAYAAMISDLDEHIGAVMAKLNELGLDQKTLVVVSSDNGATHDVGGADTGFFKSVAGLRGRKGSCYEGGLKVPTLVRWRGVIEPGTEVDVPSYFPDWFPTLGKVAGAGLSGLDLDGIDLSPVFAGRPVKDREKPMVWEFSGYGGIVAIRDGHWKAIRRNINRQKALPWELYHLGDDPGETKDLAAQFPDRVAKLQRHWLDTRIDHPEFRVKHLR